MLYNRPSLEALQQRLYSDIIARLPLGEEPQRANILNILSHVQAGAFHSLYGMMDFYLRQIFPSTAEGEFLDRLLIWRGIQRRPAAPAVGFVTIKGQGPKVIKARTFFISPQTERYESLEDTLLESGACSVKVRAVEAGLKGNMAQGVLSFLQPLDRVETEVLIEASGLKGGTDGEADEAYRLRGLEEALGGINHYGASGDWIFWAKQSSQLVDKAFETVDFHGTGVLQLHVLKAHNTPFEMMELNALTEHLRPLAPLGVLWSTGSPSVQKIDMRLVISSKDMSYQRLVEDALHRWFEKNSYPGFTVSEESVRRLLSVLSPPPVQVILEAPVQKFDQDVYPVLGTMDFSVVS